MIGLLRRGATLASVVSLLAACDVATVERAPSTIALNHCNGDSDCGGGSCVNSQCRSRGGALQSLLFEITPPADGSPIAGVQFLKAVNPLPSADEALPLDLSLVSQVVGRVLVVNRKCVPVFFNGPTQFATSGDGTIPVFVTLTPSATALGLYSSSPVVKSTLIMSSYYAFSVNAPPGDYDIYVEPESQIDNTCPVPPQLRRSQHLNGGSVSQEIQLVEPNTFELHVSWPAADGALSGWSVDMLDPATGRVISNRVPLAISDSERTDYVAMLSYFPVVVGKVTAANGDELLRLSPPEGLAAPTVLLARSALGLFNANKGTLSNFTALPKAVHVQGQVVAQATPRPVASTVTLFATKITGLDPGVLGSFVRTVVANSNGLFELDLLPGTYRVSAVPSVELDNLASAEPDSDSNLAEASQEWVVPSSPSMQAGKVVTLENALPINGNVRDAANNPVATALVQAVASPASLQADALRQALGEVSSVPRASTTNVGSDGNFALRADSGTFDLTVRPLASTGFGWLLFPSVGVGTTAMNAGGANLGTSSLPLPVSYSGTVTQNGEDKLRVPNALIRAYIYVSKGEYVADARLADSVLQVAETRADMNGAFEILIPASVNPKMP